MAVRDYVKQRISIHSRDSGAEKGNELHHSEAALISSTDVAAPITLPPVTGKTLPGDWQPA